ncbi:TonB-dependent receptor [Porifericola rhodea]|uniref:TonB-dependent receptor n=1 Tax=Porifericola rhodea TaxID=930972 RepID=UPI002665922C|nr:TonB-dependent receptor [Porifericola rhodea]WKN33882.1 TonB-dependent receptor [Porifericola rhodea]
MKTSLPQTFRLWLCLALSTIAFGVAAQGSYTLQGSIREKGSEESLPNATIVIRQNGKGTVTNQDGYFTLLNVPSDTSTLLITYIGYRSQLLKLSPDKIQQRLTIYLEEEVNELEEIVFSAPGSGQMIRASENISQISISPAQMAALPSLGEKDIFRSLQLLPGVSGSNEASSGLYVRGGTPDQNLILLDGFTVYHVDHFYGFFSAFNADAIKDVQLYKGGFGAQYGGRISSAMELTGKTGNVNQLSGKLGLSAVNANAMLEIPLGGKGALLVAGRRSYTDIIQNGLYNDIFDLYNDGSAQGQAAPAGGQPPTGGGFGGGGRRFGREFQQNTVEPTFFFYDLNAKLSYNPSDRDIIALSVYRGADDLDNSRSTQNAFSGGNNNTDRTLSTDTKDVLNWGNRSSSLRWARQWNGRFYTNAIAAYSNYYSVRDRSSNITTTSADTVTTRSNGTAEDNDLQDFTFRLDNELLIGKSHQLGFGGQLTHNDINYNYTLNDTLDILSRKDEGMLSAIYVQDIWKLTDRLSLTAGLRASYFDVTEELYYEPRASASYQLTERFRLKAAWGKYYQFANRIVREDVSQGSRDFWLLADDESNSVSSAIHYIGGISYETEDYLFDVEYYQKEMEGLSEFSLRFSRPGADIADSQLFYEGTGIARGVEFLLQKKSGAFNGWVSYTLGEVVHNFPALSDHAFYALHDQRHELKIVGSYQLGNWTFASTWIYATGKPYSAPYGEYELNLLDGATYTYVSVGEKNAFRLPDYHRLDLSASLNFQLFGQKANAGMSVFNLYNQENIWYKEFEVSEGEVIETDVSLIGFTPSLFFNISF